MVPMQRHAFPSSRLHVKPQYFWNWQLTNPNSKKKVFFSFDMLGVVRNRIFCVTVFLVKLLFTDFRLAMKCVFEPATAYRHRLTGPGAWPGARDAIMGQIERTYYPLTDGQYFARQSKKRSSPWKQLLLIGIILSVGLKLALTVMPDYI